MRVKVFPHPAALGAAAANDAAAAVREAASRSGRARCIFATGACTDLDEVVYDQITEVEDYSIEQRGQKKKPEGITWPLRFLRHVRKSLSGGYSPDHIV